MTPARRSREIKRKQAINALHREPIPDGVFISRSGVLAVTKDGISLPYISILGVPA